MSKSPLYKVIFENQGQIYEVFARGVSEGALFGFIEIEEIVFGERSKVVVDPSEEKLKSEFEGVQRTYVPMHNIIRIDEVEHQGQAKITAVEGGKAGTPIPFPVYSPSTDK
jgi:hypothetical protein